MAAELDSKALTTAQMNEGIHQARRIITSAVGYRFGDDLVPFDEHFKALALRALAALPAPAVPVWERCTHSNAIYAPAGREGDADTRRLDRLEALIQHGELGDVTLNRTTGVPEVPCIVQVYLGEALVPVGIGTTLREAIDATEIGE